LPRDKLRTERDLLARSWLTASNLLHDGDYARTCALIDEILPTARRLENPSRTALLLMGRAIARPYAAHSQTRAEFQQALTMARDAGDPLAVGYILSHYGSFLCIDGDASRARALHEEMLTIANSLPDENMRAEAHYDLAMDAISAGDLLAAEPHLAVAVHSYRDMDHLDGLTRCLGALSALALGREQEHLAARLTGAAAQARDSIGLTPWPTVTEAERRTVERTEALLPGEEFTAQVTAGRKQTIADALTQVPLSRLGGSRRCQADEPDVFSCRLQQRRVLGARLRHRRVEQKQPCAFP
jgi:hypothetical protein